MIEYQLKNKENLPNTFNLALTGFRIVFMGTPEFAVASLEALVKAGFNIVGVVTAPDKPAGRGMKLQASEVKKYAVKHGLKILQPEKLKDPAFLDELKTLHADLQVVVAFRMLPEVVWSMPPKGTINLHGSLLPQYRGAAPINWAIINGETETGVTTFKLKHEIDTGDILMQETIPIEENEMAGDVHDKMKDLGARLLVETVRKIAEGNAEAIPQSDVLNSPNTETNPVITKETILKHAPKIFTATANIDWNKSVDEIHNLIRGLSPYPGAFTELGDKTIKIFKGEKEAAIPTSKPGRWESDKSSYLKFAAKDGYILLKEVQLEGKKRMSIDEFLRGYRF
jgi:methionyl-tRNA formyltransferase